MGHESGAVMKRSWVIEGIATSWLLLGGAALSVGACNGDGRSQPSPIDVGSGTTTGSAGVGGGGSDNCENGERRSCKVEINETNCFVGEERCENGIWSECLPAEDGLQGNAGDWHANSISPPASCTGNPCNPVCQTFDEDPTPDLEAGGTPPPSFASGTVNDVPTSVANACIDDTTTACGMDCTTSGYCQLDTRCVNPPGSTCVPWGDGQFATGAGNPDFTVKVSCDGASVTVCNRGDVAGGGTTGVSIWAPNSDLCGGTGCGTAMATGMGAVSTLRGSCPIPSDIAPGDCASIPCDVSGNPASYLHVNGCDEFACEPESDDANNWGYFNNSIGCTCSQTSVGSSLQPVTMYLMLDSSGSMVAQGLWNPARNAVNTFVQDPGSDAINYAFRVYGNSSPWGCTQGDCSASACQTPTFGPALLDNPTYESNLVTFLSGATTGGNGTPHSAAIQGMAQWGSAWRTGHPNDIIALVYITDGASGDCAWDGSYGGANGAVTISQPASLAYSNDNVLFYTVALPSASLILLDELAAQGGTGSAIDLTGSSSVATDLTLALQDIQGNLLSCTVPIPNASTVDPALVTATYRPTSNPDVVLTEVADMTACSGTGNEFYFSPDAVNPTDIVMCTTLCDTVRADVGSNVEISGGCAGSYTAQEHIFTYTGDCSGYPMGSSSFWDFLNYDTTVPGDATVEFAVSTSNVDETTAAMGPWTTVATATQANPDALPGSPIDLRAALGVALAQAPHAALRITVNPTTSASNTPIVDDWDIQYSCEFNE